MKQAPIESPKKILIIRLKAIGDVLMATPVIRALRRAYPQAEIHFLTLPLGEPLLRHNPYLSSVLVHPEKTASLGEKLRLFHRLRQARYDWVLDLEATPRSAWLTLATLASTRVGYAFRVREWAFTHPVPKNKLRKFQGEVCLDLARSLGVPGDGPQTEIFLGEGEKKWAAEYFSRPEVASQKWKIALNPTGAWSAKQWPVERWRELIPLLVGTFGVKPILYWGPGSEGLVGEIAQGLERSVLLKPETTLLQAAAFISKLDLLIGSDGTPQHMAQALGTPSLTLWGPGWGVGWTLPNDPRHRFLQHFLDCGPCDHTVCPHPAKSDAGGHYQRECLDLIKPATLLQLARTMLGS